MTPKKDGVQSLTSRYENLDPKQVISDEIWMKILSFALGTNTKDYYALCLVNKEFYQYAQAVFPRVFPSSVVEMKKIRLATRYNYPRYQIRDYSPLQKMLAIMDRVFEELGDHQSPLYRRKNRQIVAATALTTTTSSGKIETKTIIQWPRLEPAFFEQIYRFVRETMDACTKSENVSSILDQWYGEEWRPLYNRYTARFQVLAEALVQQWHMDLKECCLLFAEGRINYDKNTAALATNSKVYILHNSLIQFINHWNIWQGQVVVMAKTGSFLYAKLNSNVFLSLKESSYQCLGYLLFCSVSKNDDDDDDETDNSRITTRKRQKTSVGVVPLLTVLLDHMALLLPHLAPNNNRHNEDAKETDTTTNSMHKVNGNGDSLFEIVSASFRILDNLLCANHVPDQRLFPLLVMDQHIRTPSTHNPHYHVDVQAFRVKVNETKALLAEDGFRFEK